MPSITRRQLLLATTAAGVAGACGTPTTSDTPIEPDVPTRPDAAWTGVQGNDDAVRHIALGDPTPTSFVFVARTEPNAVVEVHLAEFIEDWQAQPARTLTADDSGHLRAELDGLTAGASIAVQLVRDGLGSRIVHARLPAPADVAVSVELVAGSCSHQEHIDFPSLSHAYDRGIPDLYLGLGDTVYQDANDTRVAFRALWARNLSAPAYRTVFDNTFTAFTWDDHEVANNFDPDDTERIALGRDAMREALPIRIDPQHPERLWRSLRYGSTVELFIMDQRGERRFEEGEFISPEQFEWLVASILASDATWKLVVGSVPCARLPGLLNAEVARNDSWKGDDIIEQRNAFLTAVEGTPGLVFLTGDHHLPCIARLEDEGPGSGMWEIWTGPLGSFRAPAYLLIPDNPQVLWRAQQWTATRMHFTPAGLLEVQFVGEADETFVRAVFDDRGEVVSVETEPDPNAP